METKNLIIRDSIFSDCQLFAEWEADPEVSEFFTIDDDRDYESVVKEYIDCDRQDKFLQDFDDKTGYMKFRIKGTPSHDASLLLAAAYLGFENIAEEYDTFVTMKIKEV